MEKAIFIGLGGAGVLTVGHLKAKLLEGAFGCDEKRMAQECRFLFVDTDGNAIESLRERFGSLLPPGADFVPAAELVNLGTEVPNQLYNGAMRPASGRRSADQEWLIKWMDERISSQLKSQPLSRGASALRVQGRIALWSKHHSVETALTTNLSQLRGKDGDQVAFYLVSGTCGGTGSSTFFDVSYAIYREIWNATNGTNLPVRAVLFMPKIYLEILKAQNYGGEPWDRYACNAYSFVEEAEAFLDDKWVKRDGAKFAAVAAWQHQPVAWGSQWPVFEFAICVDHATDLGGDFTEDQMYQNTAEALYLWQQGAGAGTVLGGLDNVQQSQCDGTASGDPVADFLAAGYRALKYPAFLMDEYFKDRFLHELFEWGLLGKAPSLAWPEEAQRKKHLEDGFERHVLRYLFDGSAQPGVPNLEGSRKKTLNSFLGQLSDGLFRNDKGKIVLDQVLNLDKLNAFVDSARYVTDALRTQFESDFADGETSLNGLLHLSGNGYSSDPGGPRGLEDEVEDCILRFGLRFAEDFVGRLDVLCEELRSKPGENNDLMERSSQAKNDLAKLEGESIPEAMKACQQSAGAMSIKGKKPEETLRALKALLEQKIALQALVLIIDQQLAVLAKLAVDPDSLLESYKNGVVGLREAVQEKLESKSDAKGQAVVKGLKSRYEHSLPKRFLTISQDVTATYLPDVTRFVAGGQWAEPNLFSDLYGGLVPQQTLPGGAHEPKRHGQSYGAAAKKEGLHAALLDMLCSKDDTGFQPSGYALPGATTAFFRRVFGSGQTEAPNTIAELMNIASAYIRRTALANQQVAKERNQSLKGRFTALNAKEQQDVVAKFQDARTPIFCPFKASGSPHGEYFVYSGNDQALAESLGYDPASKKQQWVEDPDPSRMVKLRVSVGWTLRDYGDYPTIKNAYDRVKYEAAKTGRVFSPHIDSRFNSQGAAKGLAMASGGQSLSEAEKLQLLAKTIFIRQLFLLAKEKQPDLLSQLLDTDSIWKGPEQRVCEPFYWDGDNLYLCTDVDQGRDGRISMHHGHFINVGSVAKNYAALWDACNRLAQQGVYNALQVLAAHAREKLHAGWVPIWTAADTEIKQKIGKGCETPSVKDFYDKLSNVTLVISKEIKDSLECKPVPAEAATVSTSTSPGASGPDLGV